MEYKHNIMDVSSGLMGFLIFSTHNFILINFAVIARVLQVWRQKSLRVISRYAAPGDRLKSVFPCIRISIMKIRSSYLYNGMPHAGKTVSLYWEGPQDSSKNI